MRARSFIVSTLAALALAVVLCATTTTSAQAVAAGGTVDVQVWPQTGQTIVITSVELPAGTGLPAVVRIPVVPGSTVEWAGEIVGTNASGDIPAQYKLVQGAGGQYAEFTLTKSLRAQIDTIVSTLTVSGQVISTKVEWVQSVTSPQTLFSVRIPSGVSDVRISPQPSGDPANNELGEALYALPAKTMAAGEKTTVTLSYDTAPAAASSSPSANSIIIALVIVLAIALVVLALVVRRRSTA